MSEDKKITEIPKAYDPSAVEDSIYKHWEDEGIFRPDMKAFGEPFSIAMPPPNATGILHVGHAMFVTLQDIMIRHARMRGRPTLWLPGTDHAAIATESRVDKNLMAETGKSKRDIGRDAFLKKVHEYVAGSQGTIKQQLRKMGASCDWSRERYTLDNELSRCVQEVFVKMHNDGLVYRGHRIVNWDPIMQTTVADDEIEYVETKTPFYTFQYGPFQIGTARPETKFGDKYVVMHPDDKRYKKYKHGDTFECEWINGKITATVIKDEAIDPEFGTGVMTITPWHDATDFGIAERHNLDKEQIIDFEGKLLAIADEFEGMAIEEARDKIVEKLDKKGLVAAIDEEYVNKIAVNYRGGATIEPQIKEQWFVSVDAPAREWKGKKRSLKEISLDVIRSNDTDIVPDRFKKTYFHWMENLHDWCISRQIWFGHRIPVWRKKLKKPVEITYFAHGTTTDNEQDKASGHADITLSELGIKQSHELKATLKGETFDAIFCSDLKRAIDSADIVFGPGAIQDKRLREADYGALTQTDSKKIEKNEKQYINTPFPEGESYKDVEKRMQDLLSDIAEKYQGKKIAIVTHKAPQFALEVLLNGKSWKQAMDQDWRKEKAWQPGWNYTLSHLKQVSVEKPKSVGWTQDPDTLDTWFSSAMWTFSTLLDKPKKNDTIETWIARNQKKGTDLSLFHPTSVLETAYEILFFWVARMIMMTTYVVGEIPFKIIYLHGLVRDKSGRKMSKTLDNGIDPLDMIEAYGTDALRLSLVIGTTPGNDTRMYEEKIAGYRNFVNKIWNIARFILMNNAESMSNVPSRAEDAPEAKRSDQPRQKDEQHHDELVALYDGILSGSDSALADQWITAKLQQLVADVDMHFEKYEFSIAGEKIYTFLWHDLADWYLEIAKTQKTNIAPMILLDAIKLLHPFTPFVTEEIYQRMKDANVINSPDELLAASAWPSAIKMSRESFSVNHILQNFSVLQDLITTLRDLRAQYNLPYSQQLEAAVATRKHKDLLQEHEIVIERMTKVRIQVLPSKPANEDQYIRAHAPSFDVYLKIDAEEKRKQEVRLATEREKLDQYIASLTKKLDNKQFMKNAPKDVVESEKKKLEDAVQKRKKIT